MNFQVRISIKHYKESPNLEPGQRTRQRSGTYFPPIAKMATVDHREKRAVCWYKVPETPKGALKPLEGSTGLPMQAGFPSGGLPLPGAEQAGRTLVQVQRVKSTTHPHPHPHPHPLPEMPRATSQRQTPAVECQHQASGPCVLGQNICSGLSFLPHRWLMGRVTGKQPGRVSSPLGHPRIP